MEIDIPPFVTTHPLSLFFAALIIFRLLWAFVPSIFAPTRNGFKSIGNKMISREGWFVQTHVPYYIRYRDRTTSLYFAVEMMVSGSPIAFIIFRNMMTYDPWSKRKDLSQQDIDGVLARIRAAFVARGSDIEIEN